MVKTLARIYQSSIGISIDHRTLPIDVPRSPPIYLGPWAQRCHRCVGEILKSYEVSTSLKDAKRKQPVVLQRFACGVNIWCQHLGSTFGVNIWCQHLVSTFGVNISPHNMSLPEGALFQQYLKEYERNLVFQFASFESEAKITNVDRTFL